MFSADGKVEYVALAGHNTVPGLVVPNTQFGVPYVEFTSTSAAIGQVAEFHGGILASCISPLNSCIRFNTISESLICVSEHLSSSTSKSSKVPMILHQWPHADHVM